MALYVVPVFPNGGSAAEQTVWASTASLYEKGSLELDWTQDLVGLLLDTAVIDGGIYSNKPPALGLVAYPAYAAARVITGPPSRANLRVSWTAMRWLGATLPAIVLGFLFLRREGSEPVAVALLLFGTPVIIYGTLLFTHVLAATLLYAAYRLALGPRAGPLACLLGGAAAGLATLTEYAAAAGVLVIAVALLIGERGRRLVGFTLFCLGGLPFAAFLGVWNQALFGDPLAMSYGRGRFEAVTHIHGQGLYGVGWPSLSNAAYLLFSPARGLLFYSPLLLLALIPLFRLRAGPDRVRRVARAAIVALLVAVLAGYGSVDGGWCAGARFLVVIVPFLVEALAEAPHLLRWRAVTGALLGISVVLCVAPALSFSFAPNAIRCPHPAFWGKFLREGWFVPTAGSLVGLGSGLLAVSPALLAVALAVVVAMLGRGLAGYLGVGLGATLALVYLFLPGYDEPGGPFNRALLMEKHFKPAGRIETYVRSARSPAERANYLGALQHVRRTRSYGANDWPYVVTPDRPR